MDDLSMFSAAAFDLVIQPVSTCYVPDVLAVYREVARVTALDGLYISQHKQPASLQAEVLPAGRGYVLSEPYYRSGPLPPVIEGCLHREAGTMEFLHRWEELIGGLCRAGFVLEDLVEPRHGDLRSEPGAWGAAWTSPCSVRGGERSPPHLPNYTPLPRLCKRGGDRVSGVAVRL